MDHSLSSLYQQVADLSAKYGAEKLVLFGSRAREDYTRISDIDLAVYGMPVDNHGPFWWDVEDLPTLLKFDIVHMVPNLDPAFIKNIEQDGVTLYENGK